MKTPFFCGTTVPLLLATALSLCSTTDVSAQGSLTPPGPPAPEMKSLAQIEPRTPISTIPFNITNSGSYYLTTNLFGTGGTAILIQTNDVSVDLNGFAMVGTGSGIGVFVNAAHTNISISHGIMQRWTEGVHAALANNCQLHHLLVSDSTFGLLAGDAALVSDCTVMSNSAVGIEIGSGGKVVNCLARMNVNNGIQTADGSSVLGCVAELNGADGINLSRGLVKDCVARLNSGNGITAFINCVVLDNTCLNNGSGGVGSGISAGNGGNRIEGNNVYGNPRGIAANPSTGNLIIRNSASGNSTNYDINIVNTAGPIVNSGSIGTSSNPHANYSY